VTVPAGFEPGRPYQLSYRVNDLPVTGTGLVAFRDTASHALAVASRSPAGALEAAELVLAAAADYKKGLRAELDEELAPFLDERGRPEDAYRSAIKRIQVRFQRRERRSEREYVDRVLLGVSALLRDRVAAAVGEPREALLNPDIVPDDELSVVRATEGLAGMEEARAALADDVNLNTRLVVEQAFLQLTTASA
jgi:hypothetical protein